MVSGLAEGEREPRAMTGSEGEKKKVLRGALLCIRLFNPSAVFPLICCMDGKRGGASSHVFSFFGQEVQSGRLV